MWKTRRARKYYRHRSSLLGLLYMFLETVDELGNPPGRDSVASYLGFEVQFNLGEMLAGMKGLRQAYSIRPDGRDIDIVLIDAKGRAIAGFEVKTRSVARGEASSIIEWLQGQGIMGGGVVSLGLKRGWDNILGAEDLVEAAYKLHQTSRALHP